MLMGTAPSSTTVPLSLTRSNAVIKGEGFLADADTITLSNPTPLVKFFISI